MSVLIVAVIFGLGFAYLATQNTMGVNFYVGPYSFTNLPLYLVAIGALLTGLIISWVLNTVDSLANAFSLRGKDQKIHQSERIVQELQAKIHDLEIENAKLKGQDTIEVRPEREEEATHQISWLDRFRHRLSI